MLPAIGLRRLFTHRPVRGECVYDCIHQFGRSVGESANCSLVLFPAWGYKSSFSARALLQFPVHCSLFPVPVSRSSYASIAQTINAMIDEGTPNERRL